ncbi:MAG: hypothetical protein WBV77_00415 [Solirubrobacteraceae bacterium]
MSFEDGVCVDEETVAMRHILHELPSVLIPGLASQPLDEESLDLCSLSQRARALDVAFWIGLVVL